MQEEVLAGQIMDTWGIWGSSTSTILKMYGAKTGGYSVQKPLVLGACIAEAPTKVIEALTNFGKFLGLAFQIKDDLLGVFSTEQTLGKQILTDILEGKWTLLLALTYQKANLDERNKIEQIVGNKKTPTKDLIWVRKLMVQTNAKKLTENILHEFIEKAVVAIVTLPLPAQKELIAVAQFMETRLK